MVLKITDPVERKRWESHLKLVNSFKNHPDRYNAEQREIIKLSSEGKSIREIRATVPGSTEKLSTARARWRRLENVNNL